MCKLFSPFKQVQPYSFSFSRLQEKFPPGQSHSVSVPRTCFSKGPTMPCHHAPTLVLICMREHLLLGRHEAQASERPDPHPSRQDLDRSAAVPRSRDRGAVVTQKPEARAAKTQRLERRAICPGHAPPRCSLGFRRSWRRTATHPSLGRSWRRAATHPSLKRSWRHVATHILEGHAAATRPPQRQGRAPTLRQPPTPGPAAAGQHPRPPPRRRLEAATRIGCAKCASRACGKRLGVIALFRCERAVETTLLRKCALRGAKAKCRLKAANPRMDTSEDGYWRSYSDS